MDNVKGRGLPSAGPVGNSQKKSSPAQCSDLQGVNKIRLTSYNKLQPEMTK